MLPTPTETPQKIVIVNESTLVDSTWVWNAAYVLAYQIRWQVCPIYGLLFPEVHQLAAGTSPTPGTVVIHLIDDLTEAPGALGYHDEEGNEVPYARVGIKTAKDNGVDPMKVISHEGLELLFNPHVNLTIYDEAKGRLYPAELCDAVQGGYDLGAPYNRKVGWNVSNFILPNWGDEKTSPTTPTDYRQTVKGPFALGSGGYLSYATSLPPSWQQELGEHAPQNVTDPDDRVRRHFGAAAA